MKKLLFMTFIACAIISTSANAQAQGGGASVTMLQQMKEKLAPQMVEKTGLTVAQAEKVIELNFEMRQAAGALRDLSAEERSKKIEELKAAKEKKMAELLTPDQLKAVKAFYEDMGKNMPAKPAGN